ncbi:MAG: hypothetical protein BWY82_00701 [Verrucomicrobia bacterium ADurb.Bin474]|nr:MAG: hypothetical protein BWY82_00701 [Verrucomicrobia bacterium ADurb.Bin474]
MTEKKKPATALARYMKNAAKATVEGIANIRIKECSLIRGAWRVITSVPEIPMIARIRQGTKACIPFSRSRWKLWNRWMPGT